MKNNKKKKNNNNTVNGFSNSTSIICWGVPQDTKCVLRYLPDNFELVLKPHEMAKAIDKTSGKRYLINLLSNNKGVELNPLIMHEGKEVLDCNTKINPSITVDNVLTTIKGYNGSGVTVYQAQFLRDGTFVENGNKNEAVSWHINEK